MHIAEGLRFFCAPLRETLPQIYFRIIPDVQALAQSPYKCITANDRGMQYYFFQYREGTEDGVFNNRGMDSRMLPDGHIRTDNGILDHTAFGNAYRRYDNSTVKSILLRRLIFCQCTQ